MLLEQLILAVCERVDGEGPRRVVGASLGEADPAADEERPDALEAPTPGDQVVVVVAWVERDVRPLAEMRLLREEPIEGLRPDCGVHLGAHRQHAVELEDAGADGGREPQHPVGDPRRAQQRKQPAVLLQLVFELFQQSDHIRPLRDRRLDAGEQPASARCQLRGPNRRVAGGERSPPSLHDLVEAGLLRSSGRRRLCPWSDRTPTSGSPGTRTNASRGSGQCRQRCSSLLLCVLGRQAASVPATIGTQCRRVRRLVPTPPTSPPRTTEPAASRMGGGRHGGGLRSLGWSPAFARRVPSRTP